MKNRVDFKKKTVLLFLLLAIIMTSVSAFARDDNNATVHTASPDATPTVYLVAGAENEPAADYLKGLESYPARTSIAFVFDNITDYDVIELTLSYSVQILSFDIPYSYSPWAVNFPAADLSVPGLVRYSLRSGDADDLVGKAGAEDIISVNILCAGDPCLHLSGTVVYKNGETAELKSVTGTSAAEVYQLGDVDGNGKIDAGDARLALRASAKLENLSDAGFVAADIDSDDNISAEEARTILRVGAKLESF